MRYFDVERKLLNSHPMHKDYNVVLPGLYLIPHQFIDEIDRRLIEVVVYCPSGENAFSSLSILYPVEKLRQLIENFYEDPEKVLIEVFKWTPIKIAKAMTKELTLADLEL